MKNLSKTNRILIIAGISLVAILILTFVLSWIKKRNQIKVCEKSGGTWDDKKKLCIPKKKPDPKPSGGTGGTGGSGTQTNQCPYNPDPLAREISENFEGWNLNTYPETVDKILVLKDCELKQLYTHYNKKYAKDYPTLTQLLENEWDDWGGKYDLLVDKLKNLGLK